MFELFSQVSDVAHGPLVFNDYYYNYDDNDYYYDCCLVYYYLLLIKLIIILSMINVNDMKILIIILIVWYDLYYNYREVVVTEFYIHCFIIVINRLLYFKVLILDFKNTLQFCLVRFL